MHMARDEATVEAVVREVYERELAEMMDAVLPDGDFRLGPVMAPARATVSPKRLPVPTWAMVPSPMDENDDKNAGSHPEYISFKDLVEACDELGIPLHKALKPGHVMNAERAATAKQAKAVEDLKNPRN